MNTRTRLITLLCVLLAVFGGGLAGLRYSQASEAKAMLDNLRTDRAELLDRLLGLTGESLMNFANDYSYWDEMLEFAARQPVDEEWARVNIDSSLATFHAHGVWVSDLDGRLVYSAVRDLDEAYRKLPVPTAALVNRLQRERFGHFYELTPAGLLEFRAAPLQPSEDVARSTPPRGWFIVARLWDDRHLHALQKILDSQLALLPGPRAESGREPHVDGIHFQRELPALDGRPAMYLHVHHFPKPLALLLRHNQNYLYLYTGIALSILIVTTVVLSRWIITPLHRLEQSLASNSPGPLGAMLGEASEFGRLAQLTAASFEQRRQLEYEIEERKRAEAALRTSEESLRDSSQLKTRLARDLHDGVIQSIYAAGLGLESMRASLHTDPAAAERRLNVTQASLNQTIREIRSFIEGLEPDDSTPTEFSTALRSLAATLQALHPAEINLVFGPEPVRLTAREEVHALQMVRESVSNAIRHGGAHVVTIELRQEHNRPRLEIRDRGRGFDPAQARVRGGSGLANLSSRASEIDAQLDIRSAPGQGTAITILFPPRQPAS